MPTAAVVFFSFNLVVNDVRMRRRVQGVDGLQDVVRQVGQIHDGIGHHCLDIGSAGH